MDSELDLSDSCVKDDDLFKVNKKYWFKIILVLRGVGLGCNVMLF